MRPKQVPQAGETPSQALSNRGVGYVELRAVDVNPYSPIGINEDTAGFLEVLALYCLLLDSPDLLRCRARSNREKPSGSGQSRSRTECCNYCG